MVPDIRARSWKKKEIDFDDEFIESCAEGEENGVPFDIAGYDKNGEEINCFPFFI